VNSPRRNYDLRSTLFYAAALAMLPFVLPSVSLATEIAIMTMAALSCHLLLVYGPLLSFGQGAFFGVGAYVGGLYAIHTAGTPAGDAVIALLLSGVAGLICAFLVGSVALRRIAGIGGDGAGGVTFLMLTFAVSQIAYFAAYSLPQWTGGDNGLLDVPRIRAAIIWSLSSPISFYGFCSVLLVLIVLAVDLVLNSVTGQAFKAIIENEDRASAVGYSVFSLRLALFTLSGGIAALAGCLYGFFLGLVPLSAIDVGQSERIVIATVLGGVGSPLGALLGTICFVLGADLLSHSWPHWPFALGAAIVLIVFFARGGIWGVVEKIARSLSPVRPHDSVTP
jgi:branched-chain amino acid transport system permease protein